MTGDDNPARREAIANQLICCEMGLEAAHDGWIGWLWDFCKAKKRLPSAIEAQHLKTETINRDRKLRELLDAKVVEPKQVEGFQTLGSSLGPATTRKVINAIEARRKRLADRVFAWADGSMKEAAE